MAEDRREEFMQKAKELEQTNEELVARGEELKQRTNGETDRREEFMQKAQQLSAMNDDLVQKGEDLVRKNYAGVESVTDASPVEETVGKAQVQMWNQKLQDYLDGKKVLDNRIKNNQDWWKLRHYGQMSTKTGTAAEGDSSQKDEGRARSVTAWAINAIINKHADYMDNYPEAVCLPVEQSDEQFAKQLSSVLPSIYERAGYEQTYSDTNWYKLVAGTSVTGYFWDKNLQNGLGDISIKKCDILELAWEPGVMNIQDSEYFFNFTIVSNDRLKQLYPENDDIQKISGQPTSVNKVTFNYDDNIKLDDHSIVVDVYYHKQNANGQNVLHYAKFVDEILLFASENIPEFSEKGYYAHGKYPFVFDTTFPIEGTPCGFGYVDIAKDPQKDLDELTDNFMHSAKEASHRRYAVNTSGSVNEKELTDVTQEVVHVNGLINDDNFRELEYTPLAGVYFNLYQQRIDELKEVANNRDAASGGTMSGVTAASAIAAMQEAGSKTSRDQESSAYRAFKEGCYFVIDLIAEFYDETRYFRITGDKGEQQFVGFNNQGIKPQVETGADGQTYTKKPIFDIKVKPQKASRYTTIAQNEFMKELWAAGIFDPQLATQASTFVQFLDFEGKEKLLQIIAQNGTIFQQLQQMQQIAMAMAQQLDAQSGGATNYTMQIQAVLMNQQVPMTAGMNTQGMNLGQSQGNDIAERAKEETRQRSEVRA